MGPQSILRGCCSAMSLLKCRPITYIQAPITLAPSMILQTRSAGHAKWQNIAKTKQANDMNKCKIFTRYVQLVRRAVIAGGRQPNPKLNSKLADVLAEASKMNVPKATLERAIDRAMNVKIISTNIEIQGPGGSVLIVRCETDNIATLRRDLKKISKKYDSNLTATDGLIGMFQSRGFIRASCKTKDNRDVDQDYAEEAAIHANVEEVSLEINEDVEDESLAKIWIFQTDAETLNQCKGELEKVGIKVLSCDLDLVPYRPINFGSNVYEQVTELSQKLREHDQVLDVFHNVLPDEDIEACPA